jgi:hypothetical protein
MRTLIACLALAACGAPPRALPPVGNVSSPRSASTKLDCPADMETRVRTQWSIPASADLRLRCYAGRLGDARYYIEATQTDGRRATRFEALVTEDFKVRWQSDPLTNSDDYMLDNTITYDVIDLDGDGTDELLGTTLSNYQGHVTSRLFVRGFATSAFTAEGPLVRQDDAAANDPGIGICAAKVSVVPNPAGARIVVDVTTSAADGCLPQGRHELALRDRQLVAI